MDRAFKARLEARFTDQLTGPVRQRHDETEIRIGPGDVIPVISALHDEPAFGFEFLADLAGVNARKVGQELETERGLVVKRGDDLGHVAGADADLGLVVTLAHGTGQLVGEAGLQAGLERAVHGQTCSGTVGPIARSGQCPRRSLTSCWSFIIP